MSAKLNTRGSVQQVRYRYCTYAFGSFCYVARPGTIYNAFSTIGMYYVQNNKQLAALATRGLLSCTEPLGTVSVKRWVQVLFLLQMEKSFTAIGTAVCIGAAVGRYLL